MPLCEFKGCGREARARGLCVGHYAQDPEGVALTPLRAYGQVRLSVRVSEACAEALGRAGESAPAAAKAVLERWARRAR